MNQQIDPNSKFELFKDLCKIVLNNLAPMKIGERKRVFNFSTEKTNVSAYNTYK